MLVIPDSGICWLDKGILPVLRLYSGGICLFSGRMLFIHIRGSL